MSSRTSSPSAVPDNLRHYYIHAENLPSALRGWKAYKDFIRQVVIKQPGWVQTHPERNSTDCVLKGREDADLAFLALRSLPCPTPLSIVVWDITDEERPVLIRQHNPQQQASAPVRSVYQDPTSVYPVPYRIPYATAPARFPNQYSSGPYHSQSPLTSIPFQPCQATYAYPQCTNTYTSGGYTDLSRHEPSAHPQHAQAYQPMHATYPLNDFNLSSNTRCASTGLQQICIQISNLAKGVREGELAQIMQSKKVNDFRSLQIARDKQTEEPRGSATATAMATFSTTHRAERAVRILDGFTFRKKVLKVKIVEERESLPAALLYPVVNGSTY